MAEVETKTTEQQETEKETTTQQNTQQETHKEEHVDVEQVKSDAVAEYLKSIGVESSDSLQAIVKKAKEDEEANKTELQKSNDTLTATTKELVTEREARIIAEAKLSAIQLGAKPEYVEDLVIVAKAKVTKDKDINAVIAEMKDSTNGKIYFADEQEEQQKKPNVTRARVKKETETVDANTDSKYAGTMAERLLKGRQAVKSHYFK